MDDILVAVSGPYSVERQVGKIPEHRRVCGEIGHALQEGAVVETLKRIVELAWD